MTSEADLRILHQRAGRKGGLQTQLQKKQERLSIYRSKLELAYSHYLHVLMLAGDILSAPQQRPSSRLSNQRQNGTVATGGTNRRKKRSI